MRRRRGRALLSFLMLLGAAGPLSACVGSSGDGADGITDKAVVEHGIPGAEAEKGGEGSLTPPPPLARRPDVTYLELGKAMLAAREPELALRAFNTSLSLEGFTAEAMTGAGIAAHRQGLVTLARRYFEKARDLAPDSIIARNNLGVVLFLLKEYYEARDEFRTAWRLSGENSDTARRNLDLVEETIALIEAGEKPDPAATQAVVRLGSDQFRLIERESEEVAAADE